MRSEYEVEPRSEEYYEDIFANSPSSEVSDVKSYKENLIPKLKHYEGFSGTTEIPTQGDVPTIGHGNTGPQAYMGNTITREQAHDLLVEDVEKRDSEIRRLIPRFGSLPINLQTALAASYYRGSLGGSPKTVKHINKGDYLKASQEFLDNDEYRDAEKLGRPGIRGRMESTSDALYKFCTWITPPAIMKGGTL